MRKERIRKTSQSIRMTLAELQYEITIFFQGRWLLWFDKEYFLTVARRNLTQMSSFDQTAAISSQTVSHYLKALHIMIFKFCPPFICIY
jgi:hypothetical protein